MNIQGNGAGGLEILRRRQSQSAQAVFNALTTPLDLSGVDFSKFHTVVTTGIGSSSAHARYLAWLLQTYGGLSSWEVPTGVFVAPPHRHSHEQALVVFSQGLSPNARFPLSFAGRFGRTVLVTSAGSETGDRALALQRAKNDGVVVVEMPVAPEYEVLLRILGPLAGYAVALRIAAAQEGIAIDFEPGVLAQAITDVTDRTTSGLATTDPAVLKDPITFVTTGGYGVLTANLCAKVIEGMFLDPPVAVDALEFSHGPLQESIGKRRTFIALGRGSEYEAALFARVRAVLEPQHRWIELTAQLPEPFHIFEHEAAMNVLTLAAIAHRRLDQREWPGKGRDGPLYNMASTADLLQPIAPTSENPIRKSCRLADLTWNEVEDRVKSGERTVVLPLGATEQHGSHLPLDVDTIVADALAERFCARIPGAIQAPTIPLGCSTEHMDFCGTLSLVPETLRAVLMDTMASLARHGFNHIVLFSAHGGNDALLKEIERELRICSSPALLTVVHGIERIGEMWRAASAHEGISPEASGAHAGEFETSIIAGLRPEVVRRECIREGIEAFSMDSQTLFYPSLKNHAPEGVVGDPRAAEAERSERYLSAWVDFLVAAYQKTIETMK